MEKEVEVEMVELKTIKVKLGTYKRLHRLKNLMELMFLNELDEEIRFSMDDVINAALDIIELSEIKFDRSIIDKVSGEMAKRK
ncbi:hypothetical protein DRO54_10600, partial [Candidatus Bathyarchaeota archaeon]